MECQTENRPVLKGEHQETGKLYLYQPGCKMWKCAGCAGTMKLLWQARIGHGYEVYSGAGFEEWAFVTITAHKKNVTAEQCLYVFPKAWAKLSARMRRKFRGIRYVILPEHHKDGRVHWHMIASSGQDWETPGGKTRKGSLITKRWLKDNCAYTGLGYMGDAAEVEDSLRAIMYVSKYIGKSLIDTDWPENLRRIRTSQGWPELPHEESFHDLDVEWEYMKIHSSEGLEQLAYKLELLTGKAVTVLKSKS